METVGRKDDLNSIDKDMLRELIMAIILLRVTHPAVPLVWFPRLNTHKQTGGGENSVNNYLKHKGVALWRKASEQKKNSNKPVDLVRIDQHECELKKKKTRCSKCANIFFFTFPNTNRNSDIGIAWRQTWYKHTTWIIVCWESINAPSYSLDWSVLQ